MHSLVPELAATSVVRDISSTSTEKQVIPHSEVPEGSKPWHRPSCTQPMFQPTGLNEKRLITLSYSQCIPDTQHTKQAREDFRHKPNLLRASKMVAISSSALGVPWLVMEKIERLEAQVKYLSEMHGASSTPIPVAYHSPFTMEIRIATLSEVFTMPRIP